MNKTLPQILEEAEKSFDEQFKGWKTTGFNLQTGEVEQTQTSDTPMVVGNREELKQFQSSQISKAYEEGRKSNISEVLKEIERKIKSANRGRAWNSYDEGWDDCEKALSEITAEIKNLGIEIN